MDNAIGTCPLTCRGSGIQVAVGGCAAVVGRGRGKNPGLTEIKDLIVVDVAAHIGGSEIVACVACRPVVVRDGDVVKGLVRANTCDGVLPSDSVAGQDVLAVDNGVAHHRNL